MVFLCFALNSYIKTLGRVPQRYNLAFADINLYRVSGQNLTSRKMIAANLVVPSLHLYTASFMWSITERMSADRKNRTLSDRLMFGDSAVFFRNCSSGKGCC